MKRILSIFLCVPLLTALVGCLPDDEGALWEFLVQYRDLSDEDLEQLLEQGWRREGPFDDCNGNGRPDVLDIWRGFSSDCDGNGIPDECQPDRDGDGLIDACDPYPDDPDNDPGAQPYTLRFFETDGHAGQGFTGCLTAEGRIGNAATSNGNAQELALRGAPGGPDRQSDFAWENGNSHTLSLVCGGGLATFEVDGVVLESTFDCGALNALHVRCRANKGTIEVSDIVVNGVFIPEVVTAGRERGNDVTILRIEGVFGEPLELTAEVSMAWREQQPPRNSQLGFELTPGWVGDPPPITDCNGNGVPDAEDIANGTSLDCDNNGVPDECQPDADGDGVIDACDGCPDDPLKTEPGACGCGVPDVDSDGDDVPDCLDECPDDPLKTEPGLCGCGVPDTDSDGDGVPDCLDECPDDPNKTAPGACGCGVVDADRDGDGVADCVDGCPDDPLKTEPGACGCGVPDVDSDGDGVPDCLDGCPDDPDKIEPGLCGCGVPDADTDGDGVPDCFDGCPFDPLKVEPGLCGCGVPDTDSDADGVPDCLDLCPDTPPGLVVDEDGCAVLTVDAGADVTRSEVGPEWLHAEVVGGTPPYIVAWSTPGWEGSSDPNVLVMPAETTTYTLTVTDSAEPPAVVADNVTITIQSNDALRFTIRTISAPGGGVTVPSALNDHGDVVGYYVNAASARRAFLYRALDGAFIDLGTLGGAEAYAHGVNNLGQVVGESRDGSGAWRAFLWDLSTGMHDLGTLGGPTATAYAVNDNGEVVGYSLAPSTLQAFHWSGGTMSGLGTDAYFQSAAFDINNAGQIVGTLVSTGNHLSTGFLYEDGALHDLGTLLLQQSQCWVINNAGLIAGYSWGSSEVHSFLYAEGLILDIGVLGAAYPKTYAYGINDAGQVVGAAEAATANDSRAALYTGGTLYDLSDLLLPGHGWTALYAAYDVNNDGQITGYGVVNGQYRTFLLTPVE